MADSNNADKKESQNNRFWDYYLVRYLAPTGFAMIILMYLSAHHKNEILVLLKIEPSFLDLFLDEKGKISFLTMSIWSGLGFLYMYISSMLVLFFHTIRFAVLNNSVYGSYKKLAMQRTDGNSAWKKDIQESYKHLREHGNAFGIMLSEILLAILLSASNFQFVWVLIIFVVWLIFGFTSWFVATRIENKFLKES